MKSSSLVLKGATNPVKTAFVERSRWARGSLRSQWFNPRIARITDGTWRARSRSKPIQSCFESGHPHGEDQFISVTAAC